MYRITLITLMCLTFTAMNGCDSGPPKPPPMIAVKGIVKLDGKPMPTGDVFFSVPGYAPSKLKVSNGAFSGEAYEGTNRVEIMTYKDGPAMSTDPGGPPTKVNILPKRYNSDTKLSADVKSGSDNDFKFDVTSS